MSLSAKNALVTGSTSGIGLATARALAKEGVNVMLNGLGDPAAIERIRAELAAEFGVKVLYSDANMLEPGEIAAMVKRAETELGSVDILVNNAGIQHVAPVDEFPIEQWNRVIAINLTASFHTMRAALPGMKARKWGRIVSTASAHSLTASPFKSAYVAAKHGLTGLTKSVALEVATMGITVPTFVVGPILQIVFGLTLAWLPLGGWNDGAIRNLIMPVLVLALPQVAVVARLTRAAMIETLRANHIRTLRSQGLPTLTITRHALRGALLPVVSYLGPAAAALLTGSIVVENIFSLPGVGRYFVEGALNRDYTLVMGTVVLVAVFVLVFNLIVDVLYAVLDPRVRFEG